MHKNLHLFPIAVCITVPLNVVITYVWSVLLEHVEPGFPYISDTGSLPPESCFFSFMLNISAILLACCVYVRYLDIDELVSRSDSDLPRRMNVSCAWVGIASCLGLAIVASFQEFNVFFVHLFGAAVCFVGGAIYFCWQTWLSIKLSKLRPVSSAMTRFRVCLCMLCILLLAIVAVTAIIAITQFDGANKMRWRQEDGGWRFHVASTSSEWLLALAFCGFILSFTGDFKSLSVSSPGVQRVY